MPARLPGFQWQLVDIVHKTEGQRCSEGRSLKFRKLCLYEKNSNSSGVERYCHPSHVV
jgi:hypothetical protein